MMVNENNSQSIQHKRNKWTWNRFKVDVCSGVIGGVDGHTVMWKNQMQEN